METGDYVVIGISLLIAIAGAMDSIYTDGFNGFAYSFGMVCGAFLVCVIPLYILLFAFRYVREHYWKK